MVLAMESMNGSEGVFFWGSVYKDRSLFLGKEGFSIAAHVFDLQFGTMYNPLHGLIYEESLDF